MASEDLVFRHFLRAVESHLADQRRQQGLDDQPAMAPAEEEQGATAVTPALPEVRVPLAPLEASAAAGAHHPAIQQDKQPAQVPAEAAAQAAERTSGGAATQAAPATVQQPAAAACEAQQRMEAGVSSMFQAGAGVPGPGVDPRAAAAGAKQTAAQLGDEALSELLMAWYYAGYTTGRLAERQRPQK